MSDQLIVRPSGWVNTALPLFQHLDGSGFEQFVTDLLNLNPTVLCQRNGRVVQRQIKSASRLLSGRRPQYGGDIRADVSGGEVWYLQCKRVQSLGASQVATVISDAEAGFPHADQYVLVTTCGLSADAQRLFDDRPNWIWWDSSRLTTLTQNLRPAESGMQFVSRHFGRDWIVRLFPWGDQPLLDWKRFFARDLSPDGQSFHHRLDFIALNDGMERLRHFACHGGGKALVMSAPGGCGKSRLLLELARGLDQEPGAPRVRFLNLNRRGLRAEEADFLSREDLQGDLVLVVDDAHRLGPAIGDVAEAASRADSVRLLVATRPHAFEAVRSSLHLHGYAERLEPVLPMKSWNLEDLVKLANQVLDMPHQVHAVHLAQLADGCPLLIVLGGSLINAGGVVDATTDEEAFRERVFKGFRDDFLGPQPEADRGRLDRLIRFLSFVSPVAKDEKLWTQAADVIECPVLQVADDMESLLAGGLLVENQEGVRLYPDLFADAMLLDACLDRGGQPSALYQRMVQRLSFRDFPALLRNLAQADWESRAKRSTEHSMFDPIWEAFLRRFDQAEWPPRSGTLTQRMTAARSLRERGADRTELLDQWASFAVYLPKRTLELAEHAVRIARQNAGSGEPEVDGGTDVSAPLPPMLKPIVMWHPKHAARALDLLWSLEVDEPGQQWSSGSNAITAIAEAAGFDLERQDTSAAAVMDWIESKLTEAAAVERARRQPWILSAVLKPFFVRELEQGWTTSRSFHLSTVTLSASRTRPLRQRALAIVDRFVNANDPVLANGLVPILREAVGPFSPKFAREVSAADHAAWRPDRLEVVKVIERAVETHRESPALLVQLGRIIRDRRDDDPDPPVKEACEQVLARFPDTFEVRVARFLTSLAHDEFRVEPGANFKQARINAERKWEDFGRRVAEEVIDRFSSPALVCEFVRRQLRELKAANSTVFVGMFMGLIAEISSEWCAGLLEEMLEAEETSLDVFLQPVIRQASVHAIEAYRNVLDVLPTRGRPHQLFGLIHHLGWKHVHGGGITEPEREALLQAASRKEAPVVSALATVAGVHFNKVPQFALEVLSRLGPAEESEATAILSSLALLAEEHAGALDPVNIGRILAKLGAHSLSEMSGVKHQVARLAGLFPRQVYEHLRGLLDAGSDASLQVQSGIQKGVPLGPVDDPDFLQREIDEQWEKLRAQPEIQQPRLGLIRSLLQSDASSAPERLREMIEQARTGAELELATRLAAPPGSKFVFQFPELVRLLRQRAADLEAAGAIRRTLWLSACGGGRSYSADDLDPESRYILTEAESLANRYRDDPLLAEFYRMIAESEREVVERYRKMDD